MQTAHESDLITLAELAVLIRRGYHTVSRMHVAGQIPRPIGTSRSHRFSRKEVLDWIAAGMPTRLEWEQRKAGAAKARKR